MDSSRPSALPDWSAVPSDLEEDRRLLNQRLAYFGATVFTLSSFFWGVNFIVRAALGVTPFTPDSWLHVLATLAFGVEWLLCRGGRRSSKQLNGIDVGTFVFALGIYAAMASVSPQRHLEPSGRAVVAALLVTLVTIAIVVTRAVVVPGTARRTLWISTIGCIPAIVAAYYVRTRVPRPTGNIPWSPIVNATYTAAWCVIAVAIATLTSRVIYGLSQRVRKASELGQYTLEEKIGEGGMGAVYRARHALLRRPTAVKLLPLERAGERSIERFEREVQLTSALTHPNTIAIYDFGHTPDGIFYYAMEYLGEGLTLEELVAHDGPQPPRASFTCSSSCVGRFKRRTPRAWSIAT